MWVREREEFPEISSIQTRRSFQSKNLSEKNEKMASDTFKSEIEERGKSDNADATLTTDAIDATDATQKRV